MEEEGIYYFFKFTRGGNQLVLANTPPSHPDIPGDSKVIFETTAGGFRDDERITWWQKEQIWGSGKYTTWDHHFQLPHKTSAGGSNLGDHGAGGEGRAQAESGRQRRTGGLRLSGGVRAALRQYRTVWRRAGRTDLPKIFPDAKRTDDIRIEQQETPMLLIQATSNCRQMTAGHKFTLQRHFNGDGKYVILKVSHSAGKPTSAASKASRIAATMRTTSPACRTSFPSGRPGSR